MNDRPRIVVIGSVNLDIVAAAERLPAVGETVTGATLDRYPGGKGANQALAARRLGASVSLIACVGKDPEAEAALLLLRQGGVDLSGCAHIIAAPTGVALIAVSPDGENQIVVAPGANRELRPAIVSVPAADALIGQLETPVETLEHASNTFDGFLCLNLAPAGPVPERLIRRADLLVVNETEAAYYGDLLAGTGALVAKTYGAEGAELWQNGRRIAEARPPAVDAVDSTGAGDAFTAALTLALVEGQAPQAALVFACAAGAAAATRPGAQTSLPTRDEVDALLGAAR